MSDIVLFRHHTHYEILAANIIAHEKRKFAEEMEADYRKICVDRESERRIKGKDDDTA